MTMKKRVEEALSYLKPHVHKDGGDIQVVEVTEDGIVYVQWLGACAICDKAELTFKYAVKEYLMENIPEIKDVIQLQ